MATRDVNSCYDGCFVLRLIPAFIAAVGALFRSRVDIALEVLALRQQVAVLKTPTTSTAADVLRSILLEHAAAGVATMVRCPGNRQARNCDRMASCRFPPLLALAITATWWPTEN